MTQAQHEINGKSGRLRDRLRGAIDLHVHSGSDWVRRLLTDEQVLREAVGAGMRGVGLKSHTRCTLEGCRRAERRLNAPGAAFPSLVLNAAELLEEPAAACAMIEAGVKVLHMPTTMAHNPANPLNTDRHRISIIDGGRLRPSLVTILASAARHGCAVATGHCGVEERLALLPACAEAGVRTVLVTHPEYHVTDISPGDQRRIARRWPNVLFERTLYSVIDESAARSRPGSLVIVPERLKRMVRGIHETGPERTVLTSDLGQTFLPRPVEGFAVFLEALAREGISEEDIDVMTKVTTLRCLGLYDEMLVGQARVAFRKGRGGFRTPFREPLVGWASAEDPIFLEFRERVSRGHLLPADFLADAASVISVFLPFGEALVEGNRRGPRPSPEWCLAYTEGNAFLDLLTGEIGKAVESCGFDFARHSAAHHLTGRHDPDIDARCLTSVWSQRHVAYACGLGTFGLNNLIITEKGCAGRLSSLVTNMPLPERRRVSVERCLAKAGKGCGKCVSICPAGALGRDGFDRVGCWRYLVECNDVSRAHDLAVVNVCGKCSSDVPCAMTNPSAGGDCCGGGTT